MKIEPHATFRFVFRDILSKNESLNRLRDFLHNREWLPIDSEYDSTLLSYHTDNNGCCEVSLKKVEGCSIEEMADMLFSDLCDTPDVICAKLLYNEHTDKLIQNHSGKYMSRQTVDLSELKENDEVIILYRK